MPHIAKIENGKVTQVIVVMDDYNGKTPEEWCAERMGGEWVRTSYSGSIRKNYAGKGYEYNREIDAFVPPKPYDSWILDEEKGRYKAPKEMPDDGKEYEWDEPKIDWVERRTE